ncbi:helix-turn-helix domain-containing protein [Paenibacillus sp. IB182496]|uniref:Helix-turn-helix domain-containing protein n=1 Tax=Paenibacillus sabuli TaxID=2772509 RepID=A0A927GTA1_9BACL|nr:helix-turn-helix domain-containing protein [Paenibacillus sabuli]MBD2847604.1 helix-turn-helix domain-containing protein [Paenibacillus sabuli]
MRYLVKRLGRQHLFVRLMIPYFLFMLVALLLGGLFYNQTYDVVKDEVLRNNMQLLDQVKGTMDNRFSEINRIALQLSGDARVQNFQRVRDPFNSENTLKVIETQKNLYSYNASNHFVLDYYLIFGNSDLALSTNSIYELPAFYRHVLSYEGMDYEMWREELLGTYRNREVMLAGAASYQERPMPLLTYVQSLGYPSRIQGALVVLVDNRSMQAMLSGLDISDGGWVSILDEHGRVISSLSKGASPAADGVAYPEARGTIEASPATGDMMVTYTTSAYNGWRYVVAQPPHVVLGKVDSIKQTTLSIVAVFLVIGLLLAYLFATRNGRPLVRIVSTLTGRLESAEPERPKDMYGYIQNSLDRLIDDNGALQNAMERQSRMLWESFLVRLLKGDFLSADEIHKLLKHQGVDLSGAGYAVALLHFRAGERGMSDETLQALDVERVLIGKVLQQTLDDDRLAYPIAEDKIALLFTDASGDPAVFRSMIDRRLGNIAKNIRDGLELDLHIAVGGICPSLVEVAGSYEEARQSLYTMQEGADPGTGIVWYDELPTVQGGFYFPPETENRLINCTKAGETEEVGRLLHTLFEVNFQARHLPIAMQQLFFYEIISCLVKVREQLMQPDPEQIKHLQQQLGMQDNPKQALDALTDAFQSISTVVDKRKKSRNSRLLDDILAYLQQSYGHSGLSLDTAADHMHISKGYMSQFFKEQMGLTFSEYLENLRMDKARELLAATELPVGQIAEQVGYHSASTFSRAFKRGSGVSATAYRESAQKDAPPGAASNSAT